MAHLAWLSRTRDDPDSDAARQPGAGRRADHPLVAIALIVAFPVVLVVALAPASVAGATDERAVDVDVVEDREPEHVRSAGGIRAFIEHDRDPLDVADDVLEREGLRVERHERTGTSTPAKPYPSGAGVGDGARRGITPEEIERSRCLDIEPRRTGSAVRAERAPAAA